MADAPGRNRSKAFIAVGAGLGLMVLLVAVIFFRDQLWRGINWIARAFGNWLTEWVPEHRGQAFAIMAFTGFAFFVNFVAHKRGRFNAWIFALVIEVGLWFLFWYRTLIPSLNELIGFNIERMPASTFALSSAIVVGITGVVFWFLELKEIWQKGK